MYHNIFDTHSHYDDSKFDPDREELLNNLQSQGVSLVVSCGCDIDSTQFNFDLAQKYDYMYFAAGFHPENLKGATLDDLKVIERFAKNDKCVAIGEIGLDYYWMDSSKEEQKKFFKAQIELAKKLDTTGTLTAIHLIFSEKQSQMALFIAFQVQRKWQEKSLSLVCISV